MRAPLIDAHALAVSCVCWWRAATYQVPAEPKGVAGVDHPLLAVVEDHGAEVRVVPLRLVVLLHQRLCLDFRVRLVLLFDVVLVLLRVEVRRPRQRVRDRRRHPPGPRRRRGLRLGRRRWTGLQVRGPVARRRRRGAAGGGRQVRGGIMPRRRRRQKRVDVVEPGGDCGELAVEPGFNLREALVGQVVERERPAAAVPRGRLAPRRGSRCPSVRHGRHVAGRWAGGGDRCARARRGSRMGHQSVLIKHPGLCLFFFAVFRRRHTGVSPRWSQRKTAVQKILLRLPQANRQS